jgi:signal transduction histidine kinase
MKFRPKSLPYSLRLTLPLLILGLGGGVNLLSYYQMAQSDHDRVERETVQRASFTGSEISAVLEYLYRDMRLEKSNEGLNVVINQLRSEANLETVLLLDDNNRVLAASGSELQGQHITQLPIATNSGLINQARMQLTGKTVLAEHRQHPHQVEAFYPVRLARQPGELQPSRVGMLVLHYVLAKPVAAAEAEVRQKGLVTSEILLCIGLLLWGLLDRLITRRANVLVAMSQSWAGGDLSDRVKLSGTDEFAKIGSAFNQMAESLEASTAAIKSSEIALRQRGEVLETTLTQLQTTQSQLVQTEKMSSLGQMVAGIAHEVNNPINFIHGNLSHVNRYTDDLLSLVALYQSHYPQPIADIETAIEDIDLDFLRQDFPQIMNSMQMGTERVKDIVLSLRNFSRLDEAASKAVNLHDGIDSTLLILQHRFKSSIRTIVVTKDYGDLPLVDCYAGQINQVLMNILANALDAIAEHLVAQLDYQPEITIRTALVGNDRVSIAIRDNGAGIPESVQQRLFDPFFTTKDVGKGTGLGLSISYQIVVDRHRGKLECRSRLGEGTEFWIELPIAL